MNIHFFKERYKLIIFLSINIASDVEEEEKKLNHWKKIVYNANGCEIEWINKPFNYINS